MGAKHLTLKSFECKRPFYFFNISIGLRIIGFLKKKKIPLFYLKLIRVKTMKSHAWSAKQKT